VFILISNRLGCILGGFFTNTSEANPTIASYNATDSLARFEKRKVFSSNLKNALAYYSAGVVAANSKVRRIGSWSPWPQTDRLTGWVPTVQRWTGFRSSRRTLRRAGSIPAAWNQGFDAVLTRFDAIWRKKNVFLNHIAAFSAKKEEFRKCYY
jgi:hypothetical protein